MSTDWTTDWAQRPTWAKPDYAGFWAATASSAADGAQPGTLIETELEAALREEIASQAEVIAAQDWQIENLKDDAADLDAELLENDQLIDKMQADLHEKDDMLGRRELLISKMQVELDRQSGQIDYLRAALRKEQQTATFKESAR